MNKLTFNEKVLLRERKKHTARRVASARYAAVSWGGYPIQFWMGGYPIQSWMGGYPIQTWDGVPPPCQLDGVSPCLDLGWSTPHQLDGVTPPGPQIGYPHQLDGVPPHLDLGWGTPWNVNRQTPVKTVPSLVLCMQAVNKKSPPAFMQEAYCLLHSKCLLCWSVSWWRGVPHRVLDGEGHSIQSWTGGTPSSLARGTPILILDGGTPHPDLGWGTLPYRPGMG